MTAATEAPPVIAAPPMLAAQAEPVTITSRGVGRRAGIVSPAFYDRALEALEDKIDLEAAAEARGEGSTIGHRKLMDELGLRSAPTMSTDRYGNVDPLDWISYSKKAATSFRRVQPQKQREAIRDAILDLVADPRPDGCTKLAGREPSLHQLLPEQHRRDMGGVNG